MSAEVDVYRPMAVEEWGLIEEQAKALARADIIPTVYRRRPENIIAAALNGRRFGWDVMASLANGSVIEGVYAVKPEAMLGLIRRAGHSVSGEATPDRARVVGKRADTGDTMTVEWSLVDAEAAGLVQIRDGKPWARSNAGKRLPWEVYPADLLWARVVGRLARRLFSDLALGIMVDGDVDQGWAQDPPSAALPAGEDAGAMPLSSEALAALQRLGAQAGLTDDESAAVLLAAGKGQPLTSDRMPELKRAVVEAARDKATRGNDGEEQPGTNQARPSSPGGQQGAPVVEHGRPPGAAPDEQEAEVTSVTPAAAHGPWRGPAPEYGKAVLHVDQAHMQVLFINAGIREREDRLRVCDAVCGWPPGTTKASNKVSPAGARAVINALEDVVAGGADFELDAEGKVRGITWRS